MTHPRSTEAMNIRPVRADDTLLMQRFLQNLGDASRRHRFHGAINACSSGLLRLMTSVDGQRHVAWVVVGQAADGPRLLGEARFVRSNRGDEAELALTVADDCRGQGISDRLMQTLLAAAGARGVQRLRAEVEPCNAHMHAFLQRHGFVQAEASANTDTDTDSEVGVTIWVRTVADLRTRSLH